MDAQVINETRDKIMDDLNESLKKHLPGMNAEQHDEMLHRLLSDIVENIMEDVLYHNTLKNGIPVT